jgi:hypothetical protein
MEGLHDTMSAISIASTASGPTVLSWSVLAASLEWVEVQILFGGTHRILPSASPAIANMVKNE